MSESKFEYVLSGCAHTRITLADALDESVAPKIRKVIKTAQDMLSSHVITGLYNAFGEPSIGRNLHQGQFFPAPLHADSGGLQMVTRGMTITEELKNKVYASQAKYSGVAMCFDDIPATQERNPALRLFMESLVEERAATTALNVVEQARQFEKLGTDAKIFLIIQGNCVDTYHKWADVCVKTIPKDLHHWVGGIAMAGTTSGMGIREDVERAFAFTSLPVPREWKRQTHLLGIGSPNRMLPFTGFLHSGRIEDYTRISYDSTTHSSALTFRRFIDKDAKNVPYGWDKVATNLVFNIVNSYFKIDANEEEFYGIVNETREDWINKTTPDVLYKYYEAMIATCMASVYHCAAQVEEQYSSAKMFKKKCSGGMLPLQHLPEIKTEEDYYHFMRHMGPYLTSKKVKRDDAFSNLEGFFDE